VHEDSERPLNSQFVGTQPITRFQDLAMPVRFSSPDVGNRMLRITVQEDGRVWRLHLAGRLASEWVGETESIWHSAQPCGKQIEIDMREVTGIDEAGRCLLRAMSQAGAHLIAKGVAMEALVEEITGKPARRNRQT
jgi:hypothetical protein